VDLLEIVDIAEDAGYPINIIHAHEILAIAEVYKEGDEVDIEDIQEAIDEHQRQCEEDNVIMRDRERAAMKYRSRGEEIGEDWRP